MNAHGERDHSAHLRLHRSASVRVLLVVAGSVCVVLGLIGAFVPVMPTTPFLLVAAACYARASRRFYNRLLNNRAFGPLIIEWQTHHSIPYRTKLTAIALMAISLSISTVLFVRPFALQMVLAALGVLLVIYMYRIPSRDRPRSLH